jgi:hypothetical protein
MLVMAFAVTVAPDARGQKDALTAAPERAERELVERWKREAAEYTIVAHGESEETLTLDNKPALRWTNPVRSTDGGLVFIWTAHGRPETVSCFYRVRWEGRLVEAHEFLSLARVGLTGSRGGRTVWSPKGPGIDSRPIPDAPKPASTPSERLRQVRALARDFRANIDTEKSPTELRMLSQPAFRFEANEKPRTQRSPDGALFAFVLTTDPEAWLLIEERPADAGPAWHYGFARMTNHSVTAKHRNRTVWEVARDPDDGNPGKPFCSRWDVGPKP